jgi:hypothetical protein
MVLLDDKDFDTAAYTAGGPHFGNPPLSFHGNPLLLCRCSEVNFWRGGLSFPLGKSERMQIEENFEALESLFVELDPLEDRFAGVLLEVYRNGGRYVLQPVARATGSRLLSPSSEDRGRDSAVLDGELGRLLGGEGLHKVCSW